MSLEDTINNTNTQKENLKTVAVQIDNKLIELGGKQATDLTDVANKIDSMVKENFKKAAIFYPTWNVDKQFDAEQSFSINLNIPRKFSRFFVVFKYVLQNKTSEYGTFVFHSKMSPSKDNISIHRGNWVYDQLQAIKLESITNNIIKISFWNNSDKRIKMWIEKVVAFT